MLYRRVLAANDHDFDALHMLGIIFAQRGQFEEAEQMLRAALSIDPAVAQCLHNYGSVLSRLGRHTDAVTSYQKALKIMPDYGPLYSDLGNALTALGEVDNALASHDKAVKVAPRSAQAHYNRGITLFKLRRYDDALKSYNWAVFLDRNHAEAHCNRGDIFRVLKHYDEAFAAYDRSLAINPNLAGAWRGRGIVLFQLKRYEEAVSAFERALALKPDLRELPGDFLLAKMHLCDWRDYESEVAGVLSAVRSGKPASIPFALLPVPSSPADQLQCARNYIGDVPSAVPFRHGQIYSHDRIRVAYLSSDFREHPMGRLTAGLFERHDKSGFEVTAISYGREEPESDMRRRLKGAFERFIDVSSRTDSEVADLIQQLEIDIAVDLNGYTDGMRLNILLRRPAPVQVSYLGFPATMGAAHIDYIIADSTVLPPDQFPYFTEKVVWLPGSYLVTDNRLAIADRVPTRAECGLPEQGFVFCCFNGCYKIVPETFRIWMRLLKASDQSVLWLIDDDPTASANLRRHAERCEVASERLIFAPRTALADHLARHRQADLFLDTLPCNAHTTASDALWSGVPVLTCLGSTFAGRVAASLLRAVGLGELVTGSLDAYEALANKLAHDPAQLAGLKAKLAHNRETCPLFDTNRFARHIEAAYTTMWRRYQSGEPPESIEIGPTM